MEVPGEKYFPKRVRPRQHARFVLIYEFARRAVRYCYGCTYTFDGRGVFFLNLPPKFIAAAILSTGDLIITTYGHRRSIIISKGEN